MQHTCATRLIPSVAKMLRFQRFLGIGAPDRIVWGSISRGFPFTVVRALVHALGRCDRRALGLAVAGMLGHAAVAILVLMRCTVATPILSLRAVALIDVPAASARLILSMVMGGSDGRPDRLP